MVDFEKMARLAKAKREAKEVEERIKYEKSKKITVSEYEKQYPGHGVVVDDTYYYSIADALEGLSPDNQSAMYGTTQHTAELDADSIMSDVLDDAYENASFDDEGVKELRAFIANWNKRYALTYYIECDLVILPDGWGIPNG